MCSRAWRSATSLRSSPAQPSWRRPRANAYSLASRLRAMECSCASAWGSKGVHLDMFSTWLYVLHMPAMIQIRNVPEALHRRLKSRAALAGMSLSDYLLSEVRAVAERPTIEDLRQSSEESRVGKAGVSKCRSGWSPEP